MPPAPGQSRRVPWFPLWAKLGLSFGGLMGALAATAGFLDARADAARERDDRNRKLEGLAVTLAGTIDGDVHATFESSFDMDRTDFQSIAVALTLARRANGLAWAGTTARDERGRYHYVVDGGDPPPYPVGYPIFDGAEARFRAFQGEPVVLEDLEDEWGLWHAGIAPIVNRQGDVVGLVEVMADAEAERLEARRRAQALVLQAAAGVVASVGAALVLGRYMSRHLDALTRFARRVAAGKLDRTVDIRVKDEIGMLAGAMNEMVLGLRERESIRDTFGRFVSPEVMEEVLGEGRPHLGGEARIVTVLMSDLRGFSALAEQLGPAGTVGLLNRYFTRMTDVVMRHRGTVSELAGDGMLVLFGAPVTRPDDALRAVACAVAMQRELSQFNDEEGRRLDMGIGINTGEVYAGNVGSEKRMKYGVVGSAINLAARLESFTVGSQVLVSEATYAEVIDAVTVGDEMEILPKGSRDLVRCFPVLSVGGPWNLAMPASAPDTTGVGLDLQAACFRVEGKRVELDPLSGRAVHLGRSRIRIRTAWKPELRATYMVRVTAGEGRMLESLYGAVAEVAAVEEHGRTEWEAEIRLSSISDEDRDAIQWLVERARSGKG